MENVVKLLPLILLNACLLKLENQQQHLYYDFMSLFTLRYCGVQQCEQLLSTSLLPHIPLVFTCDVWFQLIGNGVYSSLLLYYVEQIVLTSPFVYWVALYLTLSGYLLFSMIFFWSSAAENYKSGAFESPLLSVLKVYSKPVHFGEVELHIMHFCVLLSYVYYPTPLIASHTEVAYSVKSENVLPMHQSSYHHTYQRFGEEWLRNAWDRGSAWQDSS